MILAEQQIKSSADILGRIDLTEILVDFTFPQSEHNVKKIFNLNRRSMQCLQQYSDNGGGSVECWLNDEVTDMVLIIIIHLKVPVLLQ